MENKLFEILSYTLPSLITGGVAYYFFTAYFKDQRNTRRWLVQRDLQKESLPLRLQAFERMALYLERINPSKLLLRVAPISEEKNHYENYLVELIEQEFEHNMTQQIYMSDECWTAIVMAKNATVQIIRKSALNEKVTNADALREAILTEMVDRSAPSNTALAYLKKELKNYM